MVSCLSLSTFDFDSGILRFDKSNARVSYNFPSLFSSIPACKYVSM